MFVKWKSENILVTALGAVGHMAVGMPLFLTSALFAGREVTEVESLIAVVHGCIIHASARDVKGVDWFFFGRKCLS